MSTNGVYTPSYRDLELKVIRWAEDRKIIPNATPQAQLNKTLEELAELFQAESQQNTKKIIDGVGDTLVCLINYCALKDIDMLVCLQAAYEEIKDRKGTLLPDGTFVKETATAPVRTPDPSKAATMLVSLIAGCKANNHPPDADALVEALEGVLHFVRQNATTN